MSVRYAIEVLRRRRHQSLHGYEGPSTLTKAEQRAHDKRLRLLRRARRAR